MTGKEELGLSSTVLDSRVPPLQPQTADGAVGRPYRRMTSHEDQVEYAKDEKHHR